MSCKKSFLKNFVNSQENSCDRVTLIKLQTEASWTFFNRRPPMAAPEIGLFRLCIVLLMI